MTHDTFKNVYIDIFFLLIFWYRCYYPHAWRNSVSPVCGIFKASALCLSPFHVIYFEAPQWPLDPGPLIIGPGTTIRATIRALSSAHYHLRYHPHYHPRTTICALPFAHYHLLFNQMIVDTKASSVTQGGSDTHDDTHKTGAARTAARPLLVQKNHFINYQKFLNF